jgi:aminopeptidase N
MAGNLTRDDAQQRTRTLEIDSYAIELDLTRGPERFGTSTVIRWRAEPGSSTFCELADAEILELTLNGERLDLGAYDRTEGRIALTLPATDNELRVVATCAYSHTGQGLHHFTDPVDGNVYLHTQFATADAQRMFACFDQPDLKATFQFTVTAPGDWEVVSNTAGSATTAGQNRVWQFPATQRLSTYLAAVVAGPYHSVADEYLGPDGQRIPLRVLCRASLAAHFDAEAILDVTKRGLAFYQDAFEIAYPFDKYDQAFVPEFNLGAMENPGCITFTEEYIFRSQVTDASYERRANTILHEMSHMWFGDLVTMQWWDDLWLNESFATYAATLAQVSATRWSGAWATFADSYKARAIRQDQLPSTHPIAADIPDILSMEVNFDAITYHKGASVLRQLVATIGVPDFLAGLRHYFTEHAWGNTTLADLLRAIEQQTDRDLGEWANLWLRQAGPNTLRPEFTVDAEGRYDSFAVLQSAPQNHPTLRPHRIAIGLYQRDAAARTLSRTRRIEIDVDGERTELADLIGEQQPDLLLLNDDDLTYAKVRPDPQSLSVMLDGIGQFTDPLAQAVCLTIAWDLVRDAELPARQYVSLVLRAVGSIEGAAIVRTLLEHARTAAQLYAGSAVGPDTSPGVDQAGEPARLADGLLALARSAPAGSQSQLAYLQSFAQVAQAPVQLDAVAGLLDGTADLPGLKVDTDLRWSLLRALVTHDRAGRQQIDAELERDPTTSGVRAAAACRASIGTPEAKATAWDQISSGSLPLEILIATLDGFAAPAHAELLAPYVDKYFDLLTASAGTWPSEVIQVFARAGYPSTVVSASTVARTDEYLTRANPPAWLRRLVLEARDEMARALRAQVASHALADGT